MNPHTRSATIEIIDEHETVLHTGRFGTDQDAYQRMLAVGRRHAQRVGAVEGCQGIGRHLAQRLVADGETVLDVPAKPSARVRVFATGQGRKTDPVDAHSVAVVALRSKGLRRVQVDDATVALRLSVDHRDELGHARTQVVNRLHRLLLELLPGGAKKFLSSAQACTPPASVRPREPWDARAGGWPRTWSPSWIASTSGERVRGSEEREPPVVLTDLPRGRVVDDEVRDPLGQS